MEFMNLSQIQVNESLKIFFAGCLLKKKIAKTKTIFLKIRKKEEIEKLLNVLQDS
jgi:hypothetical protein